jgi:hypothetical protein
VAQLAAHSTCNRAVPGSSPGVGSSKRWALASVGRLPSTDVKGNYLATKRDQVPTIDAERASAAASAGPGITWLYTSAQRLDGNGCAAETAFPESQLTHCFLNANHQFLYGQLSVQRLNLGDYDGCGRGVAAPITPSAHPSTLALAQVSASSGHRRATAPMSTMKLGYSPPRPSDSPQRFSALLLRGTPGAAP